LRKKLTRRKGEGVLLNFDATSGRRAGLDEFVAMTIIGNVVEVNSKDLNVACVLSSVDRQLNGGDASFETSVKNLVLGSGGDTSSLDVDSAGKSGRSSPITVDDFSEGRCGESIGTVQILEIFGQRGSLGISRIGGLSGDERSGLSSSRINTNNRDGIGGSRGKIGDIDGGVVSGESGWGASSRGNGQDPANALTGRIDPGQTQISDMVGFIFSKSTVREIIGEILGCCGNWWGDRVGVSSGS